MMTITLFMDKLSRVRSSEVSKNPYYGSSRKACIRRNNLHLYLELMHELKTDLLFVGEAPGYKGCGITGIPFTSERILATHSFFKGRGFLCLDPSQGLKSEISASILWETLDVLKVRPLLWNIYPFHPHRHHSVRTNRTPTKAELHTGVDFLKDLLRIFEINKIIALGRKPEVKLKELGYSHIYVRHPANGGKKLFVQGLKNALK